MPEGSGKSKAARWLEWKGRRGSHMRESQQEMGATFLHTSTPATKSSAWVPKSCAVSHLLLLHKLVPQPMHIPQLCLVPPLIH